MATKETIIKRCNKKVEKLNQFIIDSIKECGGETDLYLDNSSTCIGSPEHCEPNYNIKNGDLYCGDTYLCGAYRSYEDEPDEWVEDWEFSDFLKYEKACIRRGVRYFKEYNPELDENDDAAEEFYYNL